MAGRWSLIAVAALLIHAPLAAHAREPHETRFEQKTTIGPLRVELMVEPTVATLQQTVQVRLTVASPQEVTVESPKVAARLGSFQVLEMREAPPASVGGMAAQRWDWRLEPLAVEKASPGTLALRYRESAVGEWREAPIPLPVLEVTPTASGSADPAMLRELPASSTADQNPASPGASVFTLSQLLRGLAIIVVVAGVAIALEWSRKPENPRVVLAKAALAKLRALEKAPTASPRAVVVEASALLRIYLEKGYALDAPRQSTPEFLADPASQVVLTSSQQAALREFLEATDENKFAAVEPGEDASARCLRRARAFLNGEIDLFAPRAAEDTAALPESSA